MIIDMIVFLTLVVDVSTIIVKAYEWRQDVLYGPYIFPASQVTIRNRPRWISKLAKFHADFRNLFNNVKLARVSILG